MPDIADDEGLWIDDNIRAFSHRLYSLPAVADGSCSSDREGLGNISMLGNVVNKIDHVVDDVCHNLSISPILAHLHIRLQIDKC